MNYWGVPHLAGVGLNCYYSLYLMLASLVPSPALSQSIHVPVAQHITPRDGLPQSFVPTIVQDKQGFIWMATRDGLCRYDGYTFRRFSPSINGQSASSSPGLTDLALSYDGAIWITNDQRDLDRFDPISETFTNLSRQPFFRRAFSHDTLEAIHADRHNRLWLVFRRAGLAWVDMQTRRFRRFMHRPGDRYSLSSNAVNDVQEDRQGTLWIATEQGLDRFDEQTGRFQRFAPELAPAGTSSEQAVKHLYLRPNGELWLFSANYLTRWSPGLERIVGQPFPLDKQDDDWGGHQIVADSRGNEYILLNRRLFACRNDTLQQMASPDVAHLFISLFVDQSDVLWVGTNLDGVYKYNLRAAPFSAYPYRVSFQTDLLRDWLGVSTEQVSNWPAIATAYNFRATTDSTRHLWVTTGGRSMYRIDGHTLTEVPFPVPLPDYNLERPTLLATDPAGQVWVIHPRWSGYYQPTTRQWLRFTHQLQPTISSPMLQAVVDAQYIWVATASAGLYRVDRTTGRIHHFSYQANDATSLSSNSLYWLSADPFDPTILWVGTFGGGLCRFHKQTGRCERITIQQGLPNNVIYAAIPDRSGSVWLATNQGLAQLNRTTGHIRVFTQEDGLSADEFNRFHAVSLPDGRLVLGGIRGITGFSPAQLQTDTFQPLVQLSSILVNNKLLTAGPRTKGNPVTGLTQLTLPYDQNFLTIRFAAMQYNRTERTKYRYQLVGLNQDWVIADRPEAIYTALQPGQYELRLQAANTAGQWSQHQYTLFITIRPPWWWSWWAWLGYILLATGLIWAFLRYRIQRDQEKQRMHQQQQEAEQLRQVDELKTRFFSNITHDIRTPLTLILGPAANLVSELGQGKYGEQLRFIERNARHLLALINQLMDLARLDANRTNLDLMRGQPDQVVSEVVNTFTDTATNSHIRLTYHADSSATYWFDVDKLERITVNLVGNAIKFTPATAAEPGQVTVLLRANTPQQRPGLYLSVADTGMGIDPIHFPYLFDRFYRIGTNAQSPGSGIGLALVKELVDLHGGTIDVESQAGQGTTFHVYLPYQLVETDPSAVADALMPPAAALVDSSAEPVRLLLVEDNDEMARFITQSFPNHYQIYRATNGEDALAQANLVLPDLVISDVMMPGMDGFTFCQQIKADPVTDHIPVLLLTAKSTLADRMHGLQLGADDYLSKPFHVPELLTRINNLLTRQRRLSERMQATLAMAASEPDKQPEQPVHPFLERLYAILDEHLDQTDFGVDELADAIHLSRMQLHRKLKALAGSSTTDFIRTYRLKQALPLLTGGLSISQVAYAVGFTNPAYFSQRFREQYGKSPSTFISE
jgi:signal transduction histidine kinase/CheY-like chemotaxis protein/ligand-binding sensor domain-containing protein/AraC-like DNA-binding protein